MLYLAFLVVLFPAFRFVVGDGITPTAPGPGDQFNAGSPCTIQWQVGENWSNFTISLMSGSNTQMQLVAPVASGLDGSNAALSPFNWTCPEVNPYSAIYFYQFTNSNDTTNSKWTTRFTIASPSGESSPPANSTQPNGDSIPWGVGVKLFLICDDRDISTFHHHCVKQPAWQLFKIAQVQNEHYQY
ncbi:hypothetical protein LENED_009095 [Lentinula edodes]|uniref:Yeast cell wall synthesis Kre9/Knh1-like N-terminal domain-containing protein n=1 Tax=Lentinula edodes TaxID=5353 RepID=A0A1Q3EIV7_LENED|nr:hypothetical protein LENED_009095 [Lentinula edodes]